MLNPQNTKKSVYIIIVTYNAEPWLQKCLPPLFPLPDDWKIIVVDNASADGSARKIREQFPEIICIENKQNLGFGKANNIGMRMALEGGADYVFLLNQDAWISSVDIHQLVLRLEENSDYGILSPVHKTGQGDRLDSGFEVYCCKPPSNVMISDLMLGKKLQPVYETSFINAAAWLISRSCLETVGGFDPLFFHYGEDIDYGRRVKQNGKKIGIVPSVFACHDREGRISKAEEILLEVGSSLLTAVGSEHPRKMLIVRMSRLALRTCKQLLCLRFAEAQRLWRAQCFLWQCLKRVGRARKLSLTREN